MKKCICTLLLLSAMFVGYGQTGKDSTNNQSFDPYVATGKYINQVSPVARARSDAYFEGGYWLLLWDMLYGIAIACVFIFLGLSSKIKRLIDVITNRSIQNFLFALIYFLIAYLLTFPLHVYESFFREHHYNLSNQSFGEWFKQDLIQLTINSVALSVVVVVIYVFIQKTIRKWWIWTSLLAVAFMAFVIFISPVFLDPIFNEYKPLPAGPLKTKILSLARANQVPATDVFTFDASKQSDRISANVNGLGRTTRIALNDNLLNHCTEAEVLTTMGHEIGHYVMHHIVKMLLDFAVIFFVLFFFVDWAFKKFLSASSGGTIQDMQDIRGLPLIVVFITFGFFLLTPVINTVIRTQESEADLFGLNAARQPDAEAQVDLRLLKYRKANPGKWEEIIFLITQVDITVS